MKTNTTKYPLIAAIAIATFGLASMQAAETSDEALLAKATVLKADAEKTALADVPTGKIKDSELEKENGKLVWSFDISLPDSKNITEVQVDAKTGKIVSKEIETPEDQAKEAKEDAEQKK